MKRKSKMSKKIFIERTGEAPEEDQLERVNCRKAGEVGHFMCGVCEHDYPMLAECVPCERR